MEGGDDGKDDGGIAIGIIMIVNKRAEIYDAIFYKDMKNNLNRQILFKKMKKCTGLVFGCCLTKNVNYAKSKERLYS